MTTYKIEKSYIINHYHRHITKTQTIPVAS